jgi:opine dehydrogenase
MKVAIIGAGDGGKAAAADLALAGHEISLFEFPSLEKNIKPILQEGGLSIVAEGEKVFTKLSQVTTDIKQALNGAEMIMPILPSFAHEECARVCAPNLIDGQTIVLSPGSSLGSLAFHNVLKEKDVKADLKIAEIHTLPYAARAFGAEVQILLRLKKLWLAAFPAAETDKVLRKFKALYPVTEPLRNVLEVGLNNGNPVVHATPSLLNAGRIESGRGDFYLYSEGITPYVTNVIEAVDRERLALCEKLGYRQISSLERLHITGYTITRSCLFDAYHTSPVLCGQFQIRAPNSVMHRFFTEDIGIGLVTWSSLGDLIGVETPTIDAIIMLTSRLHKIDYFSAGVRDMKNLGLSGMNPEEINYYLDSGEKQLSAALGPLSLNPIVA